MQSILQFLAQHYLKDIVTITINGAVLMDRYKLTIDSMVHDNGHKDKEFHPTRRNIQR